MSKWISVKDRMPEFSQPILYVVRGFNEKGDLYYSAVIEGSREEEGESWFWCDEYGEYDENGNSDDSIVTEWMPYPEPPEYKPCPN
jgi:hypothetical protein